MSSNEERFWRRVDRMGPVPPHCPDLGRCWIWTGFIKDTGYGQTGSAFGGTRRAHTVSFLLAHGRMPKPCALHRCDNRACVNPGHLFEGTKRDNTRDMLSKGRHRFVSHPGEDNGNAILTYEKAREIRGSSGTLRRIAEKFGISISLVWAIRHGRAWKVAACQ